MTTENSFISPERQALLDNYDRSDRSAVGFSMDYPDGLSSGMHSHPKAQLIYAVSGVMRIETTDAFFVLPPTKALFLPADEPHSIMMEGAVAMRELFIEPTFAEKVATEARVFAVTPLLRELIVALCDEPVDWDESGRTPHIVALILSEIASAKTLFTKLPSPKEARLSRVANAILEVPSDPRSLEDWAETCGVSGRTLARLFYKETGMTFGQWWLKARLNAAFIMLATDGDISKVAQKVGFSSQSAFGVAFKRTFWLTPAPARTLHLG